MTIEEMITEALEKGGASDHEDQSSLPLELDDEALPSEQLDGGCEQGSTLVEERADSKVA